MFALFLCAQPFHLLLTMHSITAQPPLIYSPADVLLITVHASVLLSSAVPNLHMQRHTAIPQTHRSSFLFSSSSPLFQVASEASASRSTPSLRPPHLHPCHRDIDWCCATRRLCCASANTSTIVLELIVGERAGRNPPQREPGESC